MSVQNHVDRSIVSMTDANAHTLTVNAIVELLSLLLGQGFLYIQLGLTFIFFFEANSYTLYLCQFECVYKFKSH